MQTLNEQLMTMTPEEKTEYNRKLQREVLKKIAIFAGIKAAVMVGTHLIARAIVKKLGEN